MHFIPRVSNYCGCISLKTGALILAWFGTVGSFIGLMFIIVAITMGVDVIVNVVRDIEVKNTTLIDLGLATFADEDEKFHILHLIVTVVLLSMLAFSLWAFIVNFLLLIGAHNNKPALVGQWLISALVWMAINFVEAVYTIGVYSKIHSDADSVRMITIIVSTVLRLGKSYGNGDSSSELT